MPINRIAGKRILDTQIFEYSDTLSLSIPEDQRHLKSGDPVVINTNHGVAGILVSDIVPPYSAEPKTQDEVFNASYYGGNQKEGHASVRVRGGVFWVDVDPESTQSAVGSPVYLHKPKNKTSKPKVSLANNSADVILGWLYEPLTSNTGVQKAKVVLDVRKIGA